jgi:hypothetical protein
MLKRDREWLETQERQADNRVVVRLDSASAEPLEGQAGYYHVVIEGFNLYPRIAPPLVTVGGVALAQIQYQQDGRRIEGVLKEKPGTGPVTIDYGYAEAVLKDEIRWAKSER